MRLQPYLQPCFGIVISCLLYGKWKEALLRLEEAKHTKAEVAKLRLKTRDVGLEGVLFNQNL